MKLCIIFRGEHTRDKYGYTDALHCLHNWRLTILNNSTDIVFITYPSPVLEKLVREMNPIHVQTFGYDNQHSNAAFAINWMKEHETEYDRFLLLRFDFMYRLRIDKWPCWDKKGIIIVNKDIHWPSVGLYADMVFIIDRGWVDKFRCAFMDSSPFCLHHIGRALNDNKVPFHLMYNDYYVATSHPLHAWHPIEKEPNLDVIYEGVKVQSVNHAP